MLINIFDKIKSFDKSKLFFILINTFIAFLKFVRSFIFMKFLDFSELGILTIILTIIGFFGMLQIGFLNGGYRILSVDKDPKTRMEVNNITYTYFLILSCVLFIGILISSKFGSSYQVNYTFIILAILFGLIVLINNWIANILSADMNFKELNFLELTSTTISLIILLTVPMLGLKGAILTILSQPLVYLIVAFYKHKNIRPTKLFFSIKKAKWILTFGFIPFLTGIFLQINDQIEKWSILYYLDKDSLGKFYLPSLYLSLFMLIPFSVGKLFFPPAMQKFANQDFKALKKILKNYFVFLICFIVFAFVSTFFFLNPVVALLIPKHIIGIKFVWGIFPGLVALLFLEPLGLLFNASVKLKPMFWAYLTSSFILFSLIIVANKLFGFSLSLMSYIKSITAIYITLFLYTVFFIKKSYFLEINKQII